MSTIAQTPEIISSLESQFTTQQHNFELYISLRELEKFQQCLSDHSENEFIEKYIVDNKNKGIVSHSIVLGLILNVAVMSQNIVLVKKITEIIKLKFQNEIANIMTCVDHAGYNVILSTLYSGNQLIFNI